MPYAWLSPSHYVCIGIFLLAFLSLFDILILLWCILLIVFGYALAHLLVKNNSIPSIINEYRSKLIVDHEYVVNKVLIRDGEIRKNVEITETLNAAIDELTDTIMKNYIKKWYLTELGSDHAFLLEIQYHIHYAILTALRRIESVDLVQILQSEMMPILVLHVERVCRLDKKCNNAKMALPAKEVNILKEFDDLHIALWSRENESNYLRLIGDLLVEKLVDDTRIAGQEAVFERPLNSNGKTWPCHSAHHLLREILVSTILLPLLDLISDPDTINQLILLGLEDKVEPIDGKKLPSSDIFNTSYGINDAPDSLLALKLSDVVKDPRLLQLFNMYLRDQRGPNDYLDCFLLAYEIQHNKHQDDQAIFNELQSDAWQLYSDYVHESAPNRIKFSNEIVREFMTAFDTKDSALLLKAAEEVYKDLYEQLNSYYVVHFCQSEIYLSYLCGSPPDVQEFIRGPRDSPELKRSKSTEGTFSLSQFRSRLFNLMTLRYDSETGDAENKEQNSANPNMPPEIGDIALIDLSKNLNRWNIYITKIEPRKDPQGRLYYVYIIYIERNDLSSDSESGLYLDGLPSSWTIGRKYDEFYALDERLVEFHGNTIRLNLLPDKKPMQARSRAFMETQRNQFERYLQALVQQPCLKRSELLYAFLTSDEEAFETTIISELNPFKVMRKVPNKLARERGQNLKPFILNVLANVLAPTSFHAEPPSRQPNSDECSISSFTEEQYDKKYFGPKIALDNLHISRALNVTESCTKESEFLENWKRNFFEVVLFVAFRLVRLSRYVLSILIALQELLSRIINRIAKYFSTEFIQWTLKEEHLIYLIRTLEGVMNGPPNPLPSEQEIRLRSELAQRLLDDYIEDNLTHALTKVMIDKKLRSVIQKLFEVLQYPRLNKQLALVLMDVLVEKIRSSNQQATSELLYKH